MTGLISEEEQATRWRELTYTDYPPPKRLFAVVSWGAAATNWLANVLNDCPGILCLHASNFYWEHFAQAKALDGLEYMRIIGMLGTAAQAAGEVHGIARHDIPKIREAFGDSFRAMVLVRDPLPRLRSQLALFDRYAGVSSWGVDYLEPMYPDVIRGLPTGSYEEKLFVHGINMLNAVIEEPAVGPFIRMEDMTTKPEALISVVDQLTGGAVKAPQSWAEAAVASSRTNRHASSTGLTLTDWQRDVIAGVLDPRAVELYHGLGYSVDFDQA